MPRRFVTTTGLLAFLCCFSPYTALARAASEFSYWNGYWQLRSGHPPLDNAALVFDPGKPTFRVVSLVGVLLHGVSESPESKPDLRARYTQDLAGAELGPGGLMEISILTTLGFTSATGKFLSSNGDEASFGATYVGGGNRQARVAVDLFRFPGNEVLDSSDRLTIQAAARNRGPSPIYDREAALVVSMPYEFRNDLRVIRTQHVVRCDVNELPAESVVEVRCPMLQLVPGSLRSSVKLRLSIPVSLEGRSVTVQASVASLRPAASTSDFGTLNTRASAARFRVADRKKKGCRALAGVWATTANVPGRPDVPTVVGTLTLHLDGTYLSVDPNFQTSGAWKCERIGGVLHLRLGFAGTPPLFTERYPLSANRRHFEGGNSLGGFVSGDKVSDF